MIHAMKKMSMMRSQPVCELFRPMRASLTHYEAIFLSTSVPPASQKWLSFINRETPLYVMSENK